MALLGMIASFAIPKLMQSTRGYEICSKMAETVATLEVAWYNLKLQNAVIPGQTLYENLIPQLNVLASDPGGVDESSGGPLQDVHFCTREGNKDSRRGWIQFPNGVVVSGLSGPGPDGLGMPEDFSVTFPQNYVLCIDYNGPAGPNRRSHDIFLGTLTPLVILIRET